MVKNLKHKKVMTKNCLVLYIKKNEFEAKESKRKKAKKNRIIKINNEKNI